MKFYKSVKFKIIAAALLLAAILCAIFIRIIPDYSTSRGFVIVSLSDYNKYKQGYCLKEDRILPKEELYKRAIDNIWINLWICTEHRLNGEKRIFSISQSMILAIMRWKI